MFRNKWLKKISKDKGLWYQNINRNYPPLFVLMYSQLHRLAADNNTYGFAVRLKDIFEALIRFYALVGIAYADSTGDKETAALLFPPDKQLSFGDWVNTIAFATAQRIEPGAKALSHLLETLVKIYNKHNIVRWRNDTFCGHGALKREDSDTFHEELSAMLNVLTICFTEPEDDASRITITPTDGDHLRCRIADVGEFDLFPYIQYAGGEHRLYDSLTNQDKNTYKVLNYHTGNRETVVDPYFFDLQARFYGDAPITSSESFDEAFFDNSMDQALTSFHQPQHYWKQTHFIKRLNECLSKHKKGLFLFLSESGTGKSSFAHYIDGLGRHALKKQRIICRAFYFSRYSFCTGKDMPDVITESFCNAAENDTRFSVSDRLPSLNPDLTGTDAAQNLAGFLNQFADVYQRRWNKEKILLILDGIDELSVADVSLLNCIPQAELLADNVYILITCRSDIPQDSYQRRFLSGFPFTERFTFQTADGRHLLKKAVTESVKVGDAPLTEPQAEKICDILNNRFSGLSVVRALLAETEDFNDITKAPSLLTAYLDYIRQLYGDALFYKLTTILLTIATAYEPLSIRQIARFAMQDSPTIDMLAVMKDIAPLLISLRDQEGTKYVIGHQLFGEQLRSDYSDSCKKLVSDWIARLNADEQQKDIWEDSYIAGGVELWTSEILRQTIINIETIHKMEGTLSTFSKLAVIPLHLVRLIRILDGIRHGYLQHWETGKNPDYLIGALDTVTACIRLYSLLENTAACQEMVTEAERISGLLPDDCINEKSVQVLFANCVNLSLHLEQSGKKDDAERFRTTANRLLSEHDEWIPPAQKLPYVYNRAADLLQQAPDSAVSICDFLIGCKDTPAYLRIKALTLKSDALVVKEDFETCEACIQNAVELAESLIPKTADEAKIYPNTLSFYGRVKLRNHDFSAALEIFAKVMEIYESMSMDGVPLSRFEAARILSHMGEAYRGIDANSGSRQHKQQCLCYTDQSTEVFRIALKENISFKPEIASPEFINAAYAYHYYDDAKTAYALLDELASMQNPDTAEGQAVLAQCRQIKQELEAERLQRPDQSQSKVYFPKL